MKPRAALLLEWQMRDHNCTMRQIASVNKLLPLSNLNGVCVLVCDNKFLDTGLMAPGRMGLRIELLAEKDERICMNQFMCFHKH